MTIDSIHTDHINHHHHNHHHHTTHHSQHPGHHTFQIISIITLTLMMVDHPPATQGIGNTTITKTMKNTINNHNTTTIGTVIVKGEFILFGALHMWPWFFCNIAIQFKSNVNLKAKNPSISTCSASYGGRRTLTGSYLLDRDSNDPQKAVNNEKPLDGSMAMAQTMESKDEGKE